MTIPEAQPPDKSPDRITGAKAIEADQTIKPSTGQGFGTYMQKGSAAINSGTPVGQTPMELARSTNFQTTGQPSMDSLQAQAKAAQDTLGIVSQQIQTPNLQLKRSQAHLLRNKLTDAQTYSRAAAAKLGIDLPPMKAPAEGGVLARFLAYINDGQDQFAAVQQKLKELSSQGAQISPGDMMLLQSKLALAQQEIEYSSVLLSRIVSSITTIMGIQL